MLTSNVLLALAALGSTLTSAASINITELNLPRQGSQNVLALWSQSSSSVGGPGGTTISVGQGFSILTEDGKTIYNEARPAGHVACGNSKNGFSFELSGGCFGTKRWSFHCQAGLQGHVGRLDSCSIYSEFGDFVNSGQPDTDINFGGITLGTTSTCGATFELGGDTQCGENGGLESCCFNTGN